jgi:uncharacterized protein (TIGR02246 family)
VTPADRLELQDLVQRYAACVDDRDLDAAAALFALDAVLVPAHGPEAVGRSAIRAALGRLDRLAVTAHELVGQVVDRTGPHAATGRVTCIAHHVSQERDDHVWHLVYRDTYRRINGRWLFARRVLDLRFTEERPVDR